MKKNALTDDSEIKEMLDRANRPLHLDDILRIGRYSRKEKGRILSCLDSLAGSGSALRMRGGAWAATGSMKRCRGRLAVQRSGAAFVRTEGETAGDIYVAPEHIADAWNGDMVEVLLLPSGKNRQGHAEGRVLSIVERGCTEIACRVLRRAEKGRYFCQPADSRMILDILADADTLDHEPEPFELLCVAPLEKMERPFGRRPLWLAKALSSLGVENAADAQERIVKLGNSIPTEFPDNVIAEAEKVSRNVSLEGLADLRSEPLVTIDGDDARDFDDAVCVSRCQKGWRLLVAIADVSAYVRPHTALDREAYGRGNSFYFPMSVEPMLPEALSCGACSLRPHEDRRCMAAEMFLDEKGELQDTRFCNAVMSSRARLTYRQVQDVFDDPRGAEAQKLESEAPGVAAMLSDAASLATLLIERRKRNGGLDFALPEAEYLIEEKDGVRTVAGIRNRERLFSHRLIEAFMVRANEAVAEFLHRKGEPFLFRVHPDPGAERLSTLSRVLHSTCPDLTLPRPSEAGNPRWIPALLEATEEASSRNVVHNLILRSMMQARYSTEKDRHFGLASPCYCHFTSPIRRYADLENHRSLKRALGLEKKSREALKLEESADQCNRQERAATAAERETERRMGCLLLEPHVGENFSGMVSSVTSFGLFVELDGMPVEGMVRLEDLPPDWYDFDEEHMVLCGRHSGNAFRLGQRMNVKLSGVSVGRMEINLEMQDKENARGTGEGKKGFRNETEGRRQRHDRGRAAFARRKAGYRENREERFRRSEDGGDFSRGGEGGFRKPRREWDGSEPRRAFSGKRTFRSHEERERDFQGDGEARGFRKNAENGERRLRRRNEAFGGRDGEWSGSKGFRSREERERNFQGDGEARGFLRSLENGERNFRSRGERRFSGRPFRSEDGEFGGRSFPRGARHGWDHEEENTRREDSERKTFRDKEDRGHPFGRRHNDNWKPRERSGGDFRRGREERKGFRGNDRREQPAHEGMPEDFFRMEIEDDKKPVFRFGKRKK